MSKIIFFDTETTGLPEWKKPSGDASQPHLTQLAAIVCDTETQKIHAAIDLTIKPDGWVIPDEVAELNGITTEYATEYGISEEQAINAFIELWDGCHRVAHNRTFDQRIIRIALKRYGYDDALIEAWANKDGFTCTMLETKPLLEIPPKGRYGWKNPKLSEAYEHYTGKQIENAHTAMADTKACMEVYFAMMEQKKEEAA